VRNDADIGVAITGGELRQVLMDFGVVVNFRFEVLGDDVDAPHRAQDQGFRSLSTIQSAI
jgi:hypothetical protein